MHAQTIETLDQISPPRARIDERRSFKSYLYTI
jgi:hypothetical protein